MKPSRLLNLVLTYGEKFVKDKGIEVLGYPGTWATNRDECILIEENIENENG